MKITDLIYDMLVEAELTKAIRNDLNRLWGQELESDEIEKIGNWFVNNKARFSVKQPQFKTFLARFDGVHYPKFDAEKRNVRDHNSYTAEQIKFLYYEFVDPDSENVDTDEEIFLHNPNNPGVIDRSPSDAKVEASKNLWFGDKYKIIDEDGFRVYKIPNQQVSINFGYYLDTMHQAPYNIYGNKWCTTWHNTSNYYAGKRPDRSFYFVIDESKYPGNVTDLNVSKYYLTALQSMKPETGIEFKWTDITNPGEPIVEKEELLKTFPKLRGHLDELVFEPYNANELTISNPLANINEIPGNRDEFRRVSRELKQRFIAAGYPLRLSASWDSMDENLRKLYINTNDERNLVDKFASYELLQQISKSQSELTSLERRINQLFPGEGVGMLFKKVMSGEFVNERSSLKNKDVVLYRSKTTNKFGLYNARNAVWVQMGGIKYDAVYVESSVDSYFDDEGNAYIVEIYSKNMGQEDNSSFYCIFPIEDENGVDGYFLSHTKWEELKTKLNPETDELQNFNPDDDTDLSERKKGL
jgi:hypothetical protein